MRESLIEVFDVESWILIVGLLLFSWYKLRKAYREVTECEGVLPHNIAANKSKSFIAASTICLTSVILAVICVSVVASWIGDDFYYNGLMAIILFACFASVICVVPLVLFSKRLVWLSMQDESEQNGLLTSYCRGFIRVAVCLHVVALLLLLALLDKEIGHRSALGFAQLFFGDNAKPIIAIEVVLIAATGYLMFAKAKTTAAAVGEASPKSVNAASGNGKPTKRCPYCGEEILAVAKKCKHCGEWLESK